MKRGHGKAPLRALLRAVVAGVGLCVIYVMVSRLGWAPLREALRPALFWIPLIAGLEGVRIGADALAGRLLVGERGRAVPFRDWYLAQVAAHGVMNVMPAGRTAGELAKAEMLSPRLGVSVALAMGYNNQANVLLSGACFAAICAAGAFALPAGQLLGWALVIQALLQLSGGFGMRQLVTNRFVASAMRSRLPWLWARANAFYRVSKEGAAVSLRPVLAMLLGRVVQAAEVAVIAHAVGIELSWASALALQGVNLLSAVSGMVFPGQVGSSEAMFALCAGVVGTSVPRAMSIALLSHAVQVFWVGAGLCVYVFASRRPRSGGG